MNSRAWLQTAKLRQLKLSLLGINPPERKNNTSKKTNIFRLLETLSKMTCISMDPVKMPEIRTELRPPPPFEPNYTNLPSQISNLTKFDYGSAYTFKVSKWLYRLTHFKVHVVDIDSINRIIGYFGKLNDLHMVNLWVNYMMKYRIRPNRATLHLLLKYQLHKSLDTTEFTLNGMCSAGVLADAETWNYVLRCMDKTTNVYTVLEEMIKRKIPLNSKSQVFIAQRALAIELSGAQVDDDIKNTFLAIVDKQDVGVRRFLLNKILFAKAPENQNVKQALNLVKTWKDTTTETFNVFLKSFSRRGNPAFQFGILSHFTTTRFNEQSYEYFLEAALLSRNTRAKACLVGTLLKQMERENVELTARAKVLARSAVRKYELRDFGDEQFKLLKTELAWVDFKPKTPSMLNEIQNEPTLPTQPASLNIKRFEARNRTDSKEFVSEVSETIEQYQH